MPDVLVNFQVAIKPSSTVLTPAYMASAKAALAQISTGIAQTLAVSPALVRVINITDAATGDTVVLSTNSTVRLLRASSLARALGAAGSLGVSINCAVNVGKTPEEAQVLNFSAVLATPAAVSRAVAGVSAALASFAQLPASTFAVSVPATSVVLTNSRFVSAAVVVAGGTTGASSSTVAGGAGGGVAAALLLALMIWTVRSYRKHKSLPCCRDRGRERRTREAEAIKKAREQIELEMQQQQYNPVVVAGGNALDEEERAALEAFRAAKRAKKAAEKAAAAEGSKTSFNPTSATGK